MSDELTRVVEEVEFLLAERNELSSSGPHFRIVHRFRQSGFPCTPGEEVTAVFLVSGIREFFVLLPLAMRMLFDYLARHRHLPQTCTDLSRDEH